MKLPKISNIRLFNSHAFVREYKEWLSRGGSNGQERRFDVPNNILTATVLHEGMIVRYPRAITETCFDLSLYIGHSPQDEPNLQWVIPMSPVGSPADSYELRLVVFPHDETNSEDSFMADLLSRTAGSAFQCCCVLQCWNSFCLPKDKIIGIAEVLGTIPDSEIQVARYGLNRANSGLEIPGDYFDRTGWYWPPDMALMQEYANDWDRHVSLLFDL